MNCSLCRFCSSSANLPTNATNTLEKMKDGEHSSEEASQQTENSQETGEIEKEAPLEELEQVQGSAEEAPGAGDVEVRSSEAECEEASPGQHNSSGYASDGSGEPGLQCGDPGLAGGQPPGQMSSLQSDPHQSAFRPAGLPQAQYTGQMEPQAPEFQFRQNGAGGHGGWGPGPEEMAAAQGYGPQMGMITGSHPGGPMTGHPGMHTPIARRPITGNMSGYPGPPQGGYRPGPAHFPTSPAAHNNTYRQAPAFNGGQMPAAGWGSPSWSGSGPPSGPPPISMTPPPLSWNQAPNRRAHSYQGGNKPFGNIQYGGQVMQQNPVRSKNYPFPSKALNPGEFRFVTFYNTEA